jgi:hypothetical protein
MRPTTFHQPPRETDSIEGVLRDPADAPGTEPLVIRDRPLKMLLLLCVGAGIVWWYPAAGPKIILGRVLYAVLAAVIPFNVIFRRRKVILDDQGVEYVYGRRSVFIPWSAVDRTGSATTAAKFDVQIPILAAAVAAIEHRIDGDAVTHGTGPWSQWLKVTTDGFVTMRSPYGMPPSELGDVIMRVSRSLAPTVPPAPARPLPGAGAEAYQRLPDGGLEVPIAHLDFPPECCECDRPTDGRLTVQLRDGFGVLYRVPLLWIVGEVAQSHTTSVPCCPECQARARRRGWWRAAAATALFVVPAWGACAYLWLAGFKDVDIACGVAFIWTCISAPAGLSFRVWPPVDGQLLPAQSAVRLHFRRPAYADRLAEWLMERKPEGARADRPS